MINTLKYAKKLEEAGFSRLQAEANIQIIAEIIEDDVATKQDIKEIKDELQKMEYRLIIKLSTIVGALITLAVALTTAFSRMY